MNNRMNEEIEIDLVELFFHLLRHWKQLLLGLVVGGVIAGGVTYMKTPVYQSEAMLYILSKTTSITSVADFQIGNALSTDFEVIATSKPVLDTAIEQLEQKGWRNMTREKALQMINVANKEDTRLLVISATGEDPELACDLANAITEATATQMAEITKTDPPTTVERAEVATQPVDKGMKKYTGIGAIIGFLIMAVIFTIPFVANDTIQTPEDVERYLTSTVLGTIPLDKAQENHDRRARKRSKRS